MESEDDYFEDFGAESSDDDDSLSLSVIKIPSFETLTADDIVKLMTQYIEDVHSIVKVS